MNVTPTVQKLVLSLVILSFIGFVVYSTLFTEEELPLVDGQLQVKEVVGQDILTLSEQLRNVNIDKSVFSSTLFLSLVDISAYVSPEAQGRTNPFLIIGVEAPDIPVGTTNRP